MKRSEHITAGLIFLSSFIFYWLTLAPTVLWGDSAKLALYVYDFNLHPGLMGGHPLHTVAGKLFGYLPIEDFAYRQNLMSAFFGSATLLVLFLVMRRLNISALSSLLAVFSLAVSHIFWFLSVINESYTLSLFFAATLLLLLISISADEKTKIPKVYFFAFLLAFSLTNGPFTAFFFLGFLYLFAIDKNRKRLLGKIMPVSLFFALGSFLWIFVILKKIIFPGASFYEFIRSHIAVAGSYIQRVNFLKEFTRYPFYLFYQFPVFGFIIGLIGLRESFRKNKKFFFLTLVLFIAYVIFSSNYMLQRKFYILSITFFIFAIYIGYGIEFALLSIKNKKTLAKICLAVSLVISPLVIYRIMPFILHRFEIMPISIRFLPYRDNLFFYLWPGKRDEYGAKRYAEETFSSVAPNSVILTDFTPGMVLRYLQAVEGVRKDVRLEFIDRYIYGGEPGRKILEFVDDNIGHTRIYLADDETYYGFDYLEKRYDIVKNGIVYKVRRR